MIVLLSYGVTCFGQVSNDRIQNRITLALDSGWHTSTTTNSEVEWDCINKALTNKCLIYHNDQWFTVKPSSSGPLYLNVSQQTCKKLYGVQLVIIEGDPCKTDTYRLKKCIPFTDQSDFFVKLDSLDSHQEYLINIDGYLGDLCRFNIAFSSSFQGIPVDADNLNMPNLTAVEKDSVVTLEWAVDDSLSFDLKQFHVYRKKEKQKSAVRVAVPMIHNAYGAAQKKYAVYDTLKENGKYTYSIYGMTKNDMLLLGRKVIEFPKVWQAPKGNNSNRYKRQINYYANRDGHVEVVVLHGVSAKKLFVTNRRATKGRNTLTLDLSDLAERQIFFYTVIIKGKNFREEHRIKLDPSR